MKMYRSCSGQELEVINGRLHVMPRVFETNKDSTIPSGMWSFWFDKKIAAVNSPNIIVMGDFTPDMEGIMSFTEYDTRDCEYRHHTLPEFVTSKSVVVEKIWVYEFLEEVIGSYASSDYVMCPITGTKFYCGEEVDWDEFTPDHIIISKASVENTTIIERLLPLLEGSDGTKFCMPVMAAYGWATD